MTWKTHKNAAHQVSSVIGFSADFSDPVDNIPVSEDDIVEEDAPWHL